MGYMQVYRVGNSRGESPLGKISRLLTGEGIDCDDLGDDRPANGCVLIDFTRGEELVNETVSTVPQLPQILVASTMTLGMRQLHQPMILCHRTCRTLKSSVASQR